MMDHGESDGEVGDQSSLVEGMTSDARIRYPKQDSATILRQYEHRAVAHE